MSILLTVYKRLLADVREMSGVSLDAPDVITYAWVLIEAPLLDKNILWYLEHGGDEPPMPEWLKPLWNKFIVTYDPLVLRYIRQLLVFCYKAEQKPTKIQLYEAQASFEETEVGVGVWDSCFNSKAPEPLFTTGRHIITTSVREIARSGSFKNICPSHGPGAVYPPRKPWEKSRFLTLYSSIQSYYPYDQFFCGLYSFWNEVMVKEITGVICEEDDIVAALVAVPKDSRGPRLICVHPAESIWIQQGQRLVLEAAINRFPLTSGKINFTDQTVNGELALLASSLKDLVSLDLKEASDRMSATLVRYLFGETIYGWLSCSRATHVKLLDGRYLKLQKWAPMGNCLTFPVQSLVFWALVNASIRCRYGVNCTDIYVFGDDILYPSIYHEGVIRGLVMSGLIPNMAKTFVKGSFRESCGVDAYRGFDVTPLRMKKSELQTTQDAISFLDLAKRLRFRGYRACSSFIYNLVSSRFGSLPKSNNPDCQGFVEYVDRPFSALLLGDSSWTHTGKYGTRTRFNRSLQTWGVRTAMVMSVNNDTYMRDWYHVQDSLLRLAHMSTPDYVRRAEYPYPYRTRLQYGWTPHLIR